MVVPTLPLPELGTTKGGFAVDVIGNSIIDLEKCEFISCYKGGTCAKPALFVL